MIKASRWPVRYKLQVFVLTLAASLLACDSDISADDAKISDDPVSEIVAGIRPVETTLTSDQSMQVLFFLENRTGQSIEVLPWNTPLERFISADIFAVTRSEERLPYAGRVVKRAAPSATDYLTIAAGEKREHVVTVSQAYDVREAGEYRIRLEALNLQNPKGYIDSRIIDNTVVIVRQ